MATQDRLQEAVAAYKAGDRDTARTLLAEIVQEEPSNEQAWYYLAAAETDLNKRRAALEQVLYINPNNDRARDQLDRTNAQLMGQAAPAPSAPPASAPPPPQPRARVAPVGSASAAVVLPPPPVSGFRVPGNIPDAPAHVDLPYLINAGTALFRQGLAILQNKPGAYEQAISEASWWRFWLLVATSAVVLAVLNTLTNWLTQLRLPAWVVGFSYSALDYILMLILLVPINALVLYVSAYVSHSYASGKGAPATLAEHAYTVAIVYLPAQIIGSAISLVGALIFPGLLSLVTLAIGLYSLYLVGQGFQILYNFRDGSQKWITAAIMIAAAFVMGLLVASVLLPLVLVF